MGALYEADNHSLQADSAAHNPSRQKACVYSKRCPVAMNTSATASRVSSKRFYGEFSLQ